jgi:hypothetical protein
VFSQERQSFDELVPQRTWKGAYQIWKFWDNYTQHAVRAQHMVESIQLWSRLKQTLTALQLDNVLRSFSPCPDREVFQDLAQKTAPSSLMAFYAVHGGQVSLRAQSQDHEFFSGLFGSYSCYNDYYSMRLLKIADFVDNAFISEHDRNFLIGMSPGNPRMFLFVKPDDDDPEGKIHMIRDNPANLSVREHLPVVGHGGILEYFRVYVERLERGYYKSENIIDASPSSTGISLFPDAGDAMSCCVTRGIEVRASSRWFPAGVMELYQDGLNFGYSLRMKMLDSDEKDAPETCQLVSRHWEFKDGNGTVRRVEGEAVIGKQPLFFRKDGKSGFVDLGPAGDGERYIEKTFVYQSQSGPVAGTSSSDTKLASVKGTFGFVPGSIESPTGPLFHVVVATFPLSIPYPFY